MYESPISTFGQETSLSVWAAPVNEVTYYGQDLEFFIMRYFKQPVPEG